MGWGQAVGALRRRWYVVLGGLVVTAGLAFAAWRFSPPEYSAAGTELLLPAETQDNGINNPLLQLESLGAPASIVVARLNGEDAHDRVLLTNPTAEYTVVMDPDLRGPAILITATDKTAEGALKTLAVALDAVPESLKTLQDELNVPEAARVGSMRLTMDTQATPQTSATTRTIVAALGVGLGLTIGSAVGLDAIIQRRRSSAGRGPAQPDEVRKKQPEEDRKSARVARSKPAAQNPAGDDPGDGSLDDNAAARRRYMAPRQVAQ